MPALSASSVTPGFCMPEWFAHYEPEIKPRVRTSGNDFPAPVSHNRNMARRGVPKSGPSWFIKEWMDYLEKTQAFMQKEAGWSKASASQIYNGKQDYSPKIVAEAALALHVEPWELLMPPDRAMRLRRLRADAIKIAEDEVGEPRDGTVVDLHRPERKAS